MVRVGCKGGGQQMSELIRAIYKTVSQGILSGKQIVDRVS